MTNRELATRLVDFAETVDPWGVSDACGSTENAIEMVNDCLDEDIDSVKEWLESYVGEFDEDDELNGILKSLMEDVKNFIKKNELINTLFKVMSHDICVLVEWELDEDALLEELKTADNETLVEYAKTFLVT